MMTSERLAQISQQLWHAPRGVSWWPMLDELLAEREELLSRLADLEATELAKRVAALELRVAMFKALTISLSRENANLKRDIEGFKEEISNE